MKYLSLIILLFLFVRCNNDVSTDQQLGGEQDSTIASNTSLRMGASLAAGSNFVAYYIPMQNLAAPNKPDTTVIFYYYSATGELDSASKPAIHKYSDQPIPPQPPANNKKPVIKTGPDQTIVADNTTLNGSGSSDPDGDKLTFKWVQETGSATTMVAVGAVANVTNISPGDYRFRLTVTDVWGLSNTDTIHVKRAGVTPPPSGNKPPVVDAGKSQAITLPTNSVTLTGSATDPDGTIASYLWSKQSGTGGTITNPTQATTTVTGLTAGTYIFNLKATDNAGGIGNKTTTVTVSSSTPPPTTGYTQTFASGYDQMSDMLYQGNGQYGNGTISTTTFKTGPGSFYSRPANVSSGIRSEVQYSEAAQNNTEGAIEWDVMYEVVIPDNGHSFQFHPETSGGSASPGLWHIGGRFVWVNWKGGGNTEHPTGVTIQTGKWYHMRIEYKFGSSGYFNFYIDGVKNTGGSWVGQVGDGSGQYVKVGYNGWDANSTSSRIYYDNLQIFKKN